YDRIAGRAVIENGRLGLEQIGSDPPLQPTGALADVRFTDAAGRAAAREAPRGRQPVRGPVRDLEIALSLPNFAVRGKEINAALDGRVAIATSPEGLPIIAGEVAAKRGHVEGFGQTFGIDHARLRWGGEPSDGRP